MKKTDNSENINSDLNSLQLDPIETISSTIPAYATSSFIQIDDNSSLNIEEIDRVINNYYEVNEAKVDNNALLLCRLDMEPPEIARDKYQAEIVKLQNYLELDTKEVGLLRKNAGLNKQNAKKFIDKIYEDLIALSKSEISDEDIVNEVLEKLFWVQGKVSPLSRQIFKNIV